MTKCVDTELSTYYNTVADIPEEFLAQQIDTDIEATLDFIGYKGEESFMYLFVKLDSSGADIAEVYGTYGVPWLSAPVVKLFPRETE